MPRIKCAVVCVTFTVALCFGFQDSASAAITILPSSGSLTTGLADMTTSSIGVTYSYTPGQNPPSTATGQLHLGTTSLITQYVNLDGVGLNPDYKLKSSSFSIDVAFERINNAMLPVSGQLLISGKYNSTTGPDVHMLSNSLSAFGYNPNSGIFEFVFDNTSLIGTLNGFGSNIGVILSGNFPLNAIPANFSSSFSNTGSGTADTFYIVPEPSSVIAWSLGTILFGLFRSRRVCGQRHRSKD